MLTYHLKGFFVHFWMQIGCGEMSCASHREIKDSFKASLLSVLRQKWTKNKNHFKAILRTSLTWFTK